MARGKVATTPGTARSSEDANVEVSPKTGGLVSWRKSSRPFMIEIELFAVHKLDRQSHLKLREAAQRLRPWFEGDDWDEVKEQQLQEKIHHKVKRTRQVWLGCGKVVRVAGGYKMASEPRQSPEIHSVSNTLSGLPEGQQDMVMRDYVSTLSMVQMGQMVQLIATRLQVLVRVRSTSWNKNLGEQAHQNVLPCSGPSTEHICHD